MLFAGIVSASSINGDYKGKPIVILKSNGQALTVEDAPAVIMDGRTMVPISMLRQIGLGVEWNAEEYSVDVTLPVVNSSHDILILKAYSRIAEQYKRLGALGDIISSLSEKFRSTSSAISNNYRVNDSLNLSFDYLERAIDGYNNTLEETQAVIDYANQYGLDVSNMNEILNTYFESIDYYKLSYEGLGLMVITNSEINFNKYFENEKDGFDTSFQAREVVIVGYFKYYNMIQDYPE